jgi:hypothetical protein
MKTKWMGMGAAALVVLAAVAGCTTLDKAYRTEVTWTNAPSVHVFTNTVVVTNTVPVVVERTNTVYVTNEVSGAVAGYVERVPVATNMVMVLATNLVPVFMTNIVQVPVTNLVAKPEALATIGAAGSVVNAFAPGVGSILALALGGLYHGYRQIRNKRITEALIQGVETARAVLTTTPQGQAADAELVKWLMEHQKEAGVFATVTQLVDQMTDNPAARLTAAEIRGRVERSEKVPTAPGN